MKYFWITLKHKWFVLVAGLRISVPLYLLVLHDWTKFTPAELPHYDRQFFGKADDPLGFSIAWNHHQKNNKHHWEYWVPISGHTRGGYQDLQPLPMPEKYIREMVADWFGAARTYEGHFPLTKGDGIEVDWPWWDKNKEKIRAHCNLQTSIKINHILLEQGIIP